MTILENVVLFPIPATARERAGVRARDLIDRFILDDKAAHAPGAVSAEQRERLSIARMRDGVVVL